jgi:phage recombination protein Bet
MKVTREMINDALKAYVVDHPGSAFSVAEDGDKKFRYMPTGGPTVDKDIIVWELNESLKCSNQDFGLDFVEYLKPVECPKPPVKSAPDINMPERQRKPSVARVATPSTTQIGDLTLEDIKNYICPEATDQEAFMFLKLCQARNLNPFTKEAYLVKFGTKASMIVGKEAFTRKAEQHPKFAGYSAGIIVKTKDGEYEDLPGTFFDDSDGDKLIGGWAEVNRTDRKDPMVSRVSIKEYAKPNNPNWQNMPATMIRKVALVTALREAFPGEMSGMYDQSEMGLEIDE